VKRTTEFVLGLLGGIFGFFGAVFALIIGGVDAALSSSGTSEIIGLGWGAMLFAILGIIASVVVRSTAKVGGALLLVSGIGGLICISFYYILPAVLLVIAGLMGLIKKNKPINGE